MKRSEFLRSLIALPAAIEIAKDLKPRQKPFCGLDSNDKIHYFDTDDLRVSMKEQFESVIKYLDDRLIKDMRHREEFYNSQIKKLMNHEA